MTDILKLLLGGRMARPQFMGLVLSAAMAATGLSQAGATTLWTNSAGGSPLLLQQWDLTSGTVIRTVNAINGSNGRGIVQVGNYLYYTSATTNKVFKYDLTSNTEMGPIITVAGATGLSTMAYDGTYFYLGDYSGTNKVYKYSLGGVLQATILLNSCVGSCDGLEYANGSLISNRGDANSTYDKYSLAGGVPTTASFITDTGHNTTGIAFDGTNYFVSRLNTNDLLVYDSSGVYQHSITLIGSSRQIEDISVDYQAVLGRGMLKICKVAGPGVAIGASFTFTVNPGNTAVTVPAGPQPSGTCWIAGVYAAGTVVKVAENIPGFDQVTNITAPTGFTTTPVGAGIATGPIGAGVTEVTFTNEQEKTGYLEICKYSETPGTYSFTVNPGGFGPFSVPAMGCSPPIQVAAGPNVVTEATPITPGVVWEGGYIWQNGSWSPPYYTTTQSTTVNVAAGGVSDQTILLVVNGPPLKAGSALFMNDDVMRGMLKGSGIAPPSH